MAFILYCNTVLGIHLIIKRENILYKRLPNPCKLQSVSSFGQCRTFFFSVTVLDPNSVFLSQFSCLFVCFKINLFMAVLGLRFCARAFSSCGEWGPLFIAVRGPLTIAASLVAGHRLQTRRLSSCGSRAQLLRGMWDLPRPGLEPVSPELAGRFSTTAPPGKLSFHVLK